VFHIPLAALWEFNSPRQTPQISGGNELSALRRYCLEYAACQSGQIFAQVDRGCAAEGMLKHCHFREVFFYDLLLERFFFSSTMVSLIFIEVELVVFF